MSVDFLNNTWAQIRAIEKAPRVPSFLWDLFVQNEGAMTEEEVHWDYMKGNVVMAPFVRGGAPGREMPRETFSTNKLTFPTIKPERTIEYEQYAKDRSFGEEIGGALSMEERLHRLSARDTTYLRQTIQMRKEWMVSRVIQDGKLMINEYVDGGETTTPVMTADYGFTNKLNVTHKWDEPQADIYGDMMKLEDMVADGQGSPDIMIFGRDVRATITRSERLLKQLDIRNGYFGRIEPEKPQLQRGTQYIGTLPSGVELYCYSGTVKDKKNGPEIPLIDKGNVIMGSAKMLRAMFGPVAQVERESESPKVYVKEEVPFRYSVAGGTAVMQRLTSRPAILPVNIDGWAVASVL